MSRPVVVLSLVILGPADGRRGRGFTLTGPGILTTSAWAGNLFHQARYWHPETLGAARHPWDEWPERSDGTFRLARLRREVTA